MATQAKIVVTAEDRASKVLGQVRSQMQQAGESAAALASSAGLIGPAFATLASVAGLAAFVKHVVDVTDKFNDVADATGASIESLSVLDNVVRRNGGSFDTAADILIKFNKALGAAGDGNSDAARVFQALGLSVKDLKAQDPAEALNKTAVALQGFAVDGDKARAVQELFGKSIREAAPFLKDLAEAGKVNATITTAQADAAERFNKVLYKFNAESENTKRALVITIGGALVELIDRYRAAERIFGGLGGIVSAGLNGQAFSNASEGLAEYNKQLLVVDQNIRAIEERRAKSGPLADRQLIDLNDLNRQRTALAKFADFYRSVVNADGAGAGRGNNPGKLPSLKVPDKPGLPTKLETSESARALANYVDQLQKQIDKTNDLTESQKALNLLQSLGITGEIPQVRELVLGLASRLQISQDQEEIEKGITAELDRQHKVRSTLDQALDNFSGRAGDAIKQAQTARLEQRLALGESFSATELERIVKGIAGIGNELDATTGKMDATLEQFAKNVQDALGQTVEDTLRGNFSNIGTLWANMLVKMTAQAIAADIAGALFGDILSGGKTGDKGVFGSLVSAGLGFVFGGGKAGGGPVGAQSLQRVNENGFEVFSQGGRDWLMTGSQGGRVTPNHALGGGGSVVQVGAGQVINIGQGVSRAEVVAAVSQANAANRAAIMRTLGQRGVAS